MPEHSRFEELCALAVTGQISASDSAELEAHLKTCETCRKAQADFVEIESLWLSPESESAFHSREIGATLSQRILRHMQAAGARFSKPVLRQIGGRPPLSIPTLRSLPVPAYVASVFLLFVVGVMTGIEFSHQNGFRERNAKRTSPPAAVSTAPAVAQKLTNDVEIVAALHTEEQLKQKLAAAEAERAHSLARLEEAERELADVQSARRQDAAEIANLRSAANQSRMQALDTQAQLEKLKQIELSREADFIAAEYRAREAEGKLAEQAAAVQRERELLSAGREIRDVIGARNLHIVDVADVGGNGVKKPFGRVFYTEGKSLIFYAYDLANPKGKQAFYAWGHREGDPHSTRILGLVYSDDQAQKRWAFKFDDPKVLAEIDSVFVTLEPNDTPGETPKGKKLLKAFLGTPPNHP
jgi:hypothetical protein